MSSSSSKPSPSPPPTSPPPPLRIGMIGGGTVGGGVYDLVMTPGRPLSNNSGLVVRKLCVRDPARARDFTIDPDRTEVVSDVRDVLDDDDIDVVVEVMGGTTLAREVVMEALDRKKHVVTANKALVAEYLPELERMLSSGDDSGTTTFSYEAAVCGGIPIIAALQSAYRGDVVRSLRGICNGTTNYMLTKMETGEDYAAVLREAQDLGFAEADPTADVEGHDVRAKLAILTRLAFHTHVPVERIPCRGIAQITKVDFELAREKLDCTIKLLGTAYSSSNDDKTVVTVYVAPTMVPRQHFLASMSGSANAVAIESDNLGLTTYSGPGAGRFPTANSVVADLAKIRASTVAEHPFGSSSTTSSVVVDNDYTAAFYLRVSGCQKKNFTEALEQQCEQHGVPVRSVLLSNSSHDGSSSSSSNDGTICITTDKIKYSQMQALCDHMEGVDGTTLTTTLFMPML